MPEQIKLCPWCKSTKIMSEGDGNGHFVTMVCQKCLASGPRVDASLGREGALKAWNDRSHGKFSKVTCPKCHRIVPLTGCGLWTHHGFATSKTCPGSGTKP